MKRNDVIVIICAVVFTICIGIYIYLPQNDIADGEVVIYKDGNEYQVIPLYRDETITIEDDSHFNVIRVLDGKALMAEANCTDQVCVHTRPATKDGQSVVCLPNKVVITVRSKTTDGIDGVSE